MLDATQFKDRLIQFESKLRSIHQDEFKEYDRFINQQATYYNGASVETTKESNPWLKVSRVLGCPWGSFSFSTPYSTSNLMPQPYCCGMMLGSNFPSYVMVRSVADAMLDFAYQNTYTKVQFNLTPKNPREPGNIALYKYLKENYEVEELSFKSIRTYITIHTLLVTTRPFK
jgi:hypothetical protein